MSRKKRISKREELKKKGVFLHEDHSMVTRRDFLAAGAIQFSAAMFAPSLLSLLLKSTSASAEECPSSASAASSLPAFIQLNLAGGAMLASNFVPRDAGGQLIANMNLMGLGGASALGAPGLLTGELGVAAASWFNSQNAGVATSMINGIRATNVGLAALGVTDVSAEILAKTRTVAVVARTGDDTNMNKLRVAGLAAQAGMMGTKLPALSVNNFGQQPALIPQPSPPLFVGSAADIAGAVGVEGPIGATPTGILTPAARDAVFRLVSRLSQSEASRLLSTPVTNSAQVSHLIGCATTANEAIAAAVPPPTSITTIAGPREIWGATAATALNNRDVVFGSMVHAALQGLSGPVQLEMGGYDYHDNTRTSGNTRDNNAGVVIARILQTAAALNKPVFLYVTTDGSCRSADSAAIDAPWVSDRGQAGTTLIFAYHPAGIPAVSIRDGQNAALANQIGYLTAGQAADSNYTNGWNDERAAVAVLVNYLAWALGDSAWKTRYDQVVTAAGGINLLTNTELTRVLRLGA